jgi:hypothetical protein
MTATPWKAWSSPEDLPEDLRRTIYQSGLVPLLDPEKVSHLRRTVLEVCGEVMDAYLEEHELRWRIDYVHRKWPALSLETVFRAISIEIGVSALYLHKLWYSSQRKARIKDLVHEKAQ